jgi:hypothetical protein
MKKDLRNIFKNKITTKEESLYSLIASCVLHIILLYIYIYSASSNDMKRVLNL